MDVRRNAYGKNPVGLGLSCICPGARKVRGLDCTRRRRAPIVTMASWTSCRTMAHMVTLRTRHWAARGGRMTAVCHGGCIVAKQLVHAASERASVGGAPIVAITARAHWWAVAHMLTDRTCDRAACALRMAAVRHGGGIMTHHLIHSAIHGTRARRTEAVAMTGVACGRHVAHKLTCQTSDRATCACWVAAVRHGRGLVARHLIHATVHGARAGRTVVVSITSVACRRHVANLLAGKTRNRATCACWVAAVRPGCGIMAHHLIHVTIDWTRVGRTVAVAMAVAACGTHGHREDMSPGNLCLLGGTCPSWLWNHGTSPHLCHNTLDKCRRSTSCSHHSHHMTAACGTHAHRQDTRSGSLCSSGGSCLSWLWNHGT